MGFPISLFTVDFGGAYSTSLIGGLTGGLSYDYTNKSDHILGVDTTLEFFGIDFIHLNLLFVFIKQTRL